MKWSRVNYRSDIEQGNSASQTDVLTTEPRSVPLRSHNNTGWISGLATNWELRFTHFCDHHVQIQPPARVHSNVHDSDCTQRPPRLWDRQTWLSPLSFLSQ